MISFYLVIVLEVRNNVELKLVTLTYTYIISRKQSRNWNEERSIRSYRPIQLIFFEAQFEGSPSWALVFHLPKNNQVLCGITGEAMWQRIPIKEGVTHVPHNRKQGTEQPQRPKWPWRPYC